jgi:hypothetical protein
MTSERIKEIQATTGYPDSVSIKQALLQVWNECEQSHPSPMSAEQVELLEASKIALHTLDCIEFTRDQGTASKRLETAISKIATTPSVKADGWVSVEEKPLITKDKNGYWTCTEDGDKEFIAALPYTEKQKDGTYKDKWWIRHCVILDKIGLCIVGDDVDDYQAGWEIEDITHYQPLPAPPNVNNKN